jgi:glycine/D-amino acid oxidase-like deaminating enzyme
MSEVTTCDIAIIGAGVEGLSIAWNLAQRSAGKIVVFERETVGSGFTAKSSGILRCHYGVPSLAAMAWRSLPVFENAAETLDADVGYHRTGYLVGVGDENVGPLKANLATQTELGIDVQLISPLDAAELLPAMRVDDFAACAYEPRGGYGDGYQTAAAFGSAARRLGVTIRQGSPVAQIVPALPGVDLVLVNGERVSAGTLVVAAGPWTDRLVAPIGIEIPLKTQREQVMIVAPGQDIPIPPVLSDLVSLQYLRSERGTRILAGNSDHHEAEWADPDTYADRMEDEALEVAVEKFCHRFPAFTDPGLESTYAGCYDVTPDYNPVISRTEVEGVIVCTGFSGHGYKISPAVGTLVADLVLDGTSSDPDIPERDFRLERFAEGDLLVSPNPYAGAEQMR